MLRDRLRRQTLRSFDYQWADLPTGDAMLSDSWFVERVDRILAQELLALDPAWFPGRSVLDAGCGGGRWTLGLLRLGARVLSVDASAHALESTRAEMARLAPTAVAEGRLETRQVDLLDPPADLAQRRFDLVYSFGVLHHTGDTRRALANLAPLVAEGGFLFLYLYGPRPFTYRMALAVLRTVLFPLPFGAKKALLARLFPRRDVHQSFDLLSPAVNDTFAPETVEGWLRELGFPSLVRTLETGEVFLRASRTPPAAGLSSPLAEPPYWFERYRRS
jgi:SAM-dependent methyltransferase